MSILTRLKNFLFPPPHISPAKPHQSTPPRPKPPTPTSNHPSNNEPPTTDPARYIAPFLNHGYTVNPQEPYPDLVGPASIVLSHLLVVALQDFPNSPDIQNIKPAMHRLPNPMPERIQTVIELLLTAADHFDRNTTDFHHRDKKFLALYLITLLGTPEAVHAPATLSGFLDYLKNNS